MKDELGLTASLAPPPSSRTAARDISSSVYPPSMIVAIQVLACLLS
jgi:hypothetical protein